MDTGESHIAISNEQTSYSLDEKKLKQIGALLLRALGLSAFELSVRFVSSEEIAQLNTEFRQMNKPTDVLSFPQLNLGTPLTVETPFASPEWEVPEPAGDIVISLEDANRNACEIGQPISKETAFLMVHGVLHLAGHDHMNQEEEALMIKQQQILMSQIEESSPPLWHECVVESK